MTRRLDCNSAPPPIHSDRARPRSLPRLLRLLLLLPLVIASAGRASAQCLYQVVDIPQQRQVSNLRIGDVFLPRTIRVEWDYVPFTGSTPEFAIERRNGASWVSLGTTHNNYWVDVYDFPYDLKFQYRVMVTYDRENLGLPGCPPCPAPGTCCHLRYAYPTPWIMAAVGVKTVNASDNQAVDSRYDLRYSTYVFQDFLFKNITYRGGLYAGYAADPSRVGRSFLKFQLGSLPAGDRLWAGSVNAWYTRSVANGSTTVGAQSAASTWDQATLKWSTAPALTPGNATKTFTVTYNGNNSDAKWAHWTMPGDISTAVFGNGILSVGLASTNETSSAWAYFAKKEYRMFGDPFTLVAPRCLYAYGSPLWPIELTITPSQVQGGASATGHITLSGLPPGEGVVVTLTSSNTVAQVPGTVTVQGGVGADFTITTTVPQQTTIVIITASYGGMDKTATLTVTGGG